MRSLIGALGAGRGANSPCESGALASRTYEGVQGLMGWGGETGSRWRFAAW